jgi:hypothetical protein
MDTVRPININFEDQTRSVIVVEERVGHSPLSRRKPQRRVVTELLRRHRVRDCSVREIVVEHRRPRQKRRWSGRAHAHHLISNSSRICRTGSVCRQLKLQKTATKVISQVWIFVRHCCTMFAWYHMTKELLSWKAKTG